MISRPCARCYSGIARDSSLWARVYKIFIFDSPEPYLLGSNGYSTTYDSGG
jgi:hypothetical protein